MNLLRRIEKLEAARKMGDAAGEALLRKFDGMSDNEVKTALSHMTDEELNAMIIACGEKPCDLSVMTDDELNSLILEGELI